MILTKGEPSLLTSHFYIKGLFLNLPYKNYNFVNPLPIALLTSLVSNRQYQLEMFQLM